MNAVFRIRRFKKMQQRRTAVERRRLRDFSDPLDIPEDEFIRRYRLNRQLFMDLCDLLQSYMDTMQWVTAISFELQILAALSFLATGSFQAVVGNDYVFSMSQPSVSRSVEIFINCLNIIMDQMIKFPRTSQDREEIKQGFYRKFKMPGVISCIDSTHIAIIAPRNHPSESAFFNRKGYHSINAVLICDSNLIITAINAKFSGASHDSHIWNEMTVNPYIRQIYESGEPGWLIGDSGFPQLPWLMVPIREAEEGSPEEYYTKRHPCAKLY